MRGSSTVTAPTKASTVQERLGAAQQCIQIVLTLLFDYFLSFALLFFFSFFFPSYVAILIFIIKADSYFQVWTEGLTQDTFRTVLGKHHLPKPCLLETS